MGAISGEYMVVDGEFPTPHFSTLTLSECGRALSSKGAEQLVNLHYM